MEISQGTAGASAQGNPSGGAHSETPSVTQAAAGESSHDGSPESAGRNDGDADGMHDNIGVNYNPIIDGNADAGDIEGMPDIGKGILYS